MQASCKPRPVRKRNPHATPALTPGAMLGVRCHVPMEHPHCSNSYRFCCDGDNRHVAAPHVERVVDEIVGAARSTDTQARRNAGGARGARASPGACTSRGGRTSRRRAAHRRASGRATRRRAPRVGAARSTATASRRAAAACPSVWRPARFGDGATHAHTANLCGCGAATAANQRPQYRRPRWSEARPTGPTRPAQQSGAPARAGQRSDGGRCGGGRCGSSTVRSRRTQRGPATKCDPAQSAEPHRAIGRPSGQQRPSLLGRCAAEPGLCQSIRRARSQRARIGGLDVPRPVLRSAMATASCFPSGDRLGRPAVLAVRL